MSTAIRPPGLEGPAEAMRDGQAGAADEGTQVDAGQIQIEATLA